MLAARYASAELTRIWSPEHKVVLERRLWLAVLVAQRELGVEVPDGVVEAYEKVVEDVDLDSIRRREAVTRHDVKARIEEFSALAGHEHIHKGMTSRDLTENVEQLQVRSSLELVRDRAVAALARLARLATEHSGLVMAGRSHNVAAQATTLGKRFASAAEELLVAVERLDDLIERYPLRGIKGPVGTAQDQLDLLDGDVEKLAGLEAKVAEHLGFSRVLTSVGQVYPRSLDLDAVSALVQLAAGPSSLAHTIRLMAGQELATEGFRAGQVGSSAMPHKMNTRSCERVNGLAVVLRGYLSMVGELAGAQWNEGDVFCSVVRRVALPDAFFAADGLFETFLTVLDDFGAYPAVVAPRAGALPAVPRDHEGPDGSGPRGCRSRAGARGHQGARGGCGARDARAGQCGQRPVRPAGRGPPARTVPGRPRRPGRRPGVVHRGRRGPGRRRRRCGGGRRGPPPRRRRLHPRPDPLADPPSTKSALIMQLWGSWER